MKGKWWGEFATMDQEHGLATYVNYLGVGLGGINELRPGREVLLMERQPYFGTAVGSSHRPC